MPNPMPRGDQLARQWRLLHFIDRPQGVTVEDAARDLGCAVRTVWRDMNLPITYKAAWGIAHRYSWKHID